ncbi:hypothetical protein M2132_002076 [Dysgonomonas sp. PH5-45]|uniref:hypothetical protein n=1 Tax=unclassified Dysgonomonas TaxID=2630389 RepID=UPI002476AC8A|nr:MULTISPECIES: hypothetical protein [unclassified Dysgonomonas]MDH6355730.1 hypothetical protein [Dysgonomonas sp. PH5-45]MDH6388627.1 hypothetical protein [Dysgonomonas sp. PH5-37]
MQKISNILFIAVVLIFFVSCGSVDKDAKEAARFAKESVEHSKKHDLDAAADAFAKSQEIIASYREKPETAEFDSLFATYLVEDITTEEK